MSPRETSYVAIPGQPGPGRPNTRAAGDRRFAETLRLGNEASDRDPAEKEGVLVDFSTRKVLKGLSNGSLNGKQRSALAAAAAKAYQLAGRHSGLNFDEWRHEQIRELTGKAGIRELVQSDWKKVAGHFARLQGDAVKAFRAFVADGSTQNRELALAKLTHAEAEADKTGLLPVPAAQYVGGFFKNRKTTRDYASATVLVHAMFTLQRRLAQLRKPGRKQGAGSGEHGAGKGGAS